jgi:hypothetical protein
MFSKIFSSICSEKFLRNFLSQNILIRINFVNKSFLYKDFLTILVKNSFQKFPLEVPHRMFSKRFYPNDFCQNLFSIKFFSQFWLKILSKNFPSKVPHRMFSTAKTRAVGEVSLSQQENSAVGKEIFANSSKSKD